MSGTIRTTPAITPTCRLLSSRSINTFSGRFSNNRLFNWKWKFIWNSVTTVTSHVLHSFIKNPFIVRSGEVSCNFVHTESRCPRYMESRSNLSFRTWVCATLERVSGRQIFPTSICFDYLVRRARCIKVCRLMLWVSENLEPQYTPFNL